MMNRKAFPLVIGFALSWVAGAVLNSGGLILLGFLFLFGAIGIDLFFDNK